MTTLLEQKARNHALLREKLKEAYQLADDDQALIDTLEGQSDLFELCLSALREAIRREAYADAMSGVIDENRQRKARHEQAAERIRAAVAEAMAEAGEKKLTAPDLTASLRWPKPKLIIDESQIWDGYKIPIPTFKVNKDAIQAAVDTGIVPDGVTIENTPPAITVRTK